MYVFSVFEHTSRIEEAITAIQQKGIQKEAILAVPLNKRQESKNLFDTVHYSDNNSTLAWPFILAIVSTLLFSIFGFQLRWGPIIWSVIGALFGMAIGLLISVTKALIKKRHQLKKGKESIILVINCAPEQAETVQNILWHNSAMGVNQLNLKPQE